VCVCVCVYICMYMCVCVCVCVCVYIYIVPTVSQFALDALFCQFSFTFGSEYGNTVVHVYIFLVYYLLSTVL
jgi:hypothetical protein